MNQVIGAIVSLVVTIIAVRLLTKKVQPQFVLFAAGLVLLLTAVLLGAKSADILPKKVASTGWVYLDIFRVVESTLSSRVAGLGLIIMASGGFAKYMDVIGASTVMVNTVTKPLLRLKAPYLLLALSYMLGTSLKMFITSAAGLSMLLMVTIFPVVVGLGASRVAAAAMVVSCGGLSLGPGAGTTNLAADYAGMDVIKYFLSYQLPVTVATVVTMAVMHYFVQKYLDKKDGIGAAAGPDAKEEESQEKVDVRDVSSIPKYYMFLPVIPLVLLLVCSDIGIKGLKMGVVGAMLIGLTIALICECIHKGAQAKAACKEAMSFFDAMGRQFARVITMVVAGETFAQGLMATGTINLLIDSAKGAGFGVITMVLVTSGFILLSTIVMGSANAPFYSFSALAPSVAKELNFQPVAMLLPMQFAASLGRIICPITAVVVAVAGISNISPFTLVRRTLVPAMTALVVSLIASLVLTM